jgi:quinol monooxygenase YgiN
MNEQTIHFIVSLNINKGNLDSFKDIAQAMIETTEKESGALAYEWHFSPDETRCRLLETYADQSAVLAHLNGPVVQQFVPQLLQVSSISSFEVFGDPGPSAAATLSGVGAEIFPRWIGLTPGKATR